MTRLPSVIAAMLDPAPAMISLTVVEITVVSHPFPLNRSRNIADDFILQFFHQAAVIHAEYPPSVIFLSPTHPPYRLRSFAPFSWMYLRSFVWSLRAPRGFPIYSYTPPWHTLCTYLPGRKSPLQGEISSE
jgi:hypothetical protein